MTNSSQVSDPSFYPTAQDLENGIKLLLTPASEFNESGLLKQFPQHGLGDKTALENLAPAILHGAADLKKPNAFAHMDPPTPWITWLTTLWNASLNQNLLHPDLSPVATQVEALVISWLAPYFAMNGGHMTPGSTVSNLTALWAAREQKGIKQVIGSTAAHLSVAKSAHLLGLDYITVPTNRYGQIDQSMLPEDMTQSALVLTAGTTNAGAIDDLMYPHNAAWLHIDAAWAGPLMFSDVYGARLKGIDNADSIAISAHKWLFQPKDAGLILFRDTKSAHTAISFGGAYLATPNIGLMGSRSAAAIPLFATLLSWGKSGLMQRIDRAMTLSDTLWFSLNDHPKIELFSQNITGVVLWRPSNNKVEDVFLALPNGLVSKTEIDGVAWLRNVAANPNADIEAICHTILTVVDSTG